MNIKTPTAALNRLDPDEARAFEKQPLYVVLEDIRSAQNVGSIFRTMDAFQGAEIWLCGITAVPPHREIQKTALGATETVKWRYFPEISDALAELKIRNIPLFAFEQSSESLSFSDTSFTSMRPLAIAFGNEVDGVSQELINRSAGTIEIDQYGAKHSLNVSVCAGIAIWHIINAWKKSEL